MVFLNHINLLGTFRVILDWTRTNTVTFDSGIAGEIVAQFGAKWTSRCLGR